MSLYFESLCVCVCLQATCETPLLAPEAAGAPWPDAVTTPMSVRPCTYVYSAAMGATLTSISTPSVVTGSVVNISGTGFATRPYVQLVLVGDSSQAVDCDVRSFKPSFLLCTVGAGPSGQYRLRAVVGACGASMHFQYPVLASVFVRPCTFLWNGAVVPCPCVSTAPVSL